MGIATTWSHATTNGHPGSVQVAEFVLTVATGATTDTATTDEELVGEVIKYELDPGSAMATSATIKGYEDTDLATGTRDHFINYTVPESQVELVVYPLVATTTSDGATASNPLNYVRHLVSGCLTVDLADAAAADSVTVRVYVKS